MEQRKKTIIMTILSTILSLCSTFSYARKYFILAGDCRVHVSQNAINIIKENSNYLINEDNELSVSQDNNELNFSENSDECKAFKLVIQNLLTRRFSGQIEHRYLDKIVQIQKVMGLEEHFNKLLKLRKYLIGKYRFSPGELYLAGIPLPIIRSAFTDREIIARTVGVPLPKRMEAYYTILFNGLYPYYSISAVRQFAKKEECLTEINLFSWEDLFASYSFSLGELLDADIPTDQIIDCLTKKRKIMVPPEVSFKVEDNHSAGPFSPGYSEVMSIQWYSHIVNSRLLPGDLNSDINRFISERKLTAEEILRLESLFHLH